MDKMFVMCRQILTGPTILFVTISPYPCLQIQ
ncbi:hypothetical protein Spirs_4025 [Sediminispirochaeta smaragdinae DSM 11293]|uniref:Uncharacterized protein n=1 Tax=Sediminispirochaeta smaragdinae (strain DSM 11293 / JCM 15392 / SEBR 4228) TaxID=573413 RepID=E1R9E0_SEDSS|nr:hypothetical protein Spirs_4025 [Sediminispirochaeta smaragdinae DSM 11293]